MRFFIGLILAIFLAACSQKNVYVAMPSMPKMFDKTMIKDYAIPIKVGKITFARTNDYSDFFEQSNVLLRINEELSLMLDSLSEQIKLLLVNKGYKIDDNASLVLNTNISLFLKESALSKDSDHINSLLMMSLDFKSTLEDKNTLENISVTNRSGFDNPIPISYDAPSTDFVPTLFAKELYPSLFASDNLILGFYKSTLATLQNNIPSVKANKSQIVTPVQNEEIPKVNKPLITDDEAGNPTANTGSSVPSSEENATQKAPIKVDPKKGFPNQEVIIF